MNVLNKYGWDNFFEAQFEPFRNCGLIPARVVAENRKGCLIYTEFGEHAGEIPGRMYYESENKYKLPLVGDWVAVRKVEGEKKAVIEHILTRRNIFSRKAAGNITKEQIVAVNVDTIFIVTSLNEELNLRRLERYLTLTWENEISPVVILNKSDLCSDAETKRLEVESVAAYSPVHIISAKNKTGLDELRKYFKCNKTVAVIGSSGVGKTTLMNDLLNLDQSGKENFSFRKVNEISDYKDKGRHTTTRRELLLIPSGGLIIDTPGMREIQLWEGGDGLQVTFDDITEIELQCKFTDCKHDSEPDCAVKNALEYGKIERSRLKSYMKLKNEIRYIKSKQNIKSKLEEKKKWKKITSEAKKRTKMKYYL